MYLVLLFSWPGHGLHLTPELCKRRFSWRSLSVPTQCPRSVLYPPVFHDVLEDWACRIAASPWFDLIHNRFVCVISGILFYLLPAHYFGCFNGSLKLLSLQLVGGAKLLQPWPTTTLWCSFLARRHSRRISAIFSFPQWTNGLPQEFTFLTIDASQAITMTRVRFWACSPAVSFFYTPYPFLRLRIDVSDTLLFIWSWRASQILPPSVLDRRSPINYRGFASLEKDRLSPKVGNIQFQYRIIDERNTIPCTTFTWLRFYYPEEGRK